MINKKDSFTSANSLPIKIFKDEILLNTLKKDKLILPRHIQLSPTNRCNLDCAYCSYGDRNIREELTKNELEEIVYLVWKLKTIACTITGGGEPTLHPHLNSLIKTLKHCGINVGLVTNGKKLIDIDKEAMECITWIRISFDDYRKFDKDYEISMRYLCKFKKIDKAFSYVITEKPNIDNLIKILTYAHKNAFTHVRLVSDLFAVNKIDITTIENTIKDLDGSELVILQGRKEYTHGAEACQISLLKPMIAANGFVYPCCGVQYAVKEEPRDFPVSMRMCHYSKFEEVIKKQQNFNGSKCVKCYYDEYNQVLNALKSNVAHQPFL